MKSAPRTRLLLPLLALCVTVAMSALVQAQVSHAQGTSASLQINFGTQPHWMGVRGTSVRMIRDRERPDYDMFRYGGRYYVYQNDQWYMSRRPRGQFMVIEERFVPREFSRIPREHWRRYPQGWMDRNAHDNENGHGQGHSRGRGDQGSGDRDRK